jgi:hypothetical protein
MALRSSIDSAVCFFAASVGIGVVLAQISLAPVAFRRVMISSSRFS